MSEMHLDHARRELDILGWNVDTIDEMLVIIQAFQKFERPIYCANIVQQLLNLEHLTPLTDDPNDWMFVGGEIAGVVPGVWQNRRCTEAFSNDGGKTYYRLSERTENNTPIHRSESHVS